jgi:hypothetical protein
VAKPIRAELLPPRYRLAVIEEPSGRVVARFMEIPPGAVATIAEQLRALLPTLRAAATIRRTVHNVATAVGATLDYMEKARAARRPRGGRA